MSIVYRKSDRITLKVHDLTVKVAPLTFAEKAEINGLIGSAADPNGAMKGSLLAVKCAVKDIKGLTLPDGSPYKLEFENDKLTDECVDDLTNIQGGSELFIACLNLISGVPQDFINPVTGQKLEGIEVVKEKAAKK